MAKSVHITLKLYNWKEERYDYLVVFIFFRELQDSINIHVKNRSHYTPKQYQYHYRIKIAYIKTFQILLGGGLIIGHLYNKAQDSNNWNEPKSICTGGWNKSIIMSLIFPP